MTSRTDKRPDRTRTVPSAAPVTVTRAERLDDDALCSYEVHTNGEVHIVIQDKHITAEGRQCLANLLAEMLGSHYCPREPLRLVR